MNPWPWKRLREFNGRRRLSRLLKKVGGVLIIFAFILSPIGVALHVAGYARWRWTNDNWYARPFMLGAAGAVGTFLLHASNEKGLLGFYQGIFTSLGDGGSLVGVISSWLFLGALPSLVLAAPLACGITLGYELDHKAWTREMRPNLHARLRAWVNARRIASDTHSGNGKILFGLHFGDTLPWGDGRHGAIVSRSSKKVGHGFILGQQGSGKTALALNVADQFIHAGFSLAFPDFKGDSVSCDSLHASSVSAGVPFYAFSFTPMPGYTNVHYDPLDWDGSSNDKAALIMKALPFPAEDSAANYYRIKAEAYLPLQFDVLAEVGLREGEGTFDFLLDTAEPAQLQARLMPLRGNPETNDLYSRFVAAINTHNAKDLDGLRGNLQKVVNSGGKYLRPATGNGITLNLRKALEEGAVIYFELGSTLDAVSSITMGTLLMQDVKALIGQRARRADKDFRDVILMSDEASALGTRADIMDDISKQGRSSKIWNWTITQSIVTWPETTRREVVNNATVRIVFNMQEGESQLLLTEGMPLSYYISVRKGFDMGEDAVGDSAHVAGRGGTETVEEDKQLKPGQLGSLPNRRAWLWVSGADDGVKLVQGRARKRSLPWRDDAPSDVVVIKPILRNRVAAILSGDAPQPREEKGGTQTAVAPSVSSNPTPDDWEPEALPAPPSYAQLAPASQEHARPDAGGDPYRGAAPDWEPPNTEWDNDGEDEAAGSEPLAVTMARYRDRERASASVPVSEGHLPDSPASTVTAAPRVVSPPAASATQRQDTAEGAAHGAPSHSTPTPDAGKPAAKRRQSPSPSPAPAEGKSAEVAAPRNPLLPPLTPRSSGPADKVTPVAAEVSPTAAEGPRGGTDKKEETPATGKAPTSSKNPFV